MRETTIPVTRTEPDTRSWRGLCRAGAIACLLFVVYTLETIVQLTVLGGPPASAHDAFQLLRENRLLGLLRLDLPTLAAMPLYYFVFLGLFAALWRVDLSKVVISSVLAVTGVTLVIAMPGPLALLALTDKYFAATTAEARLQFQAAGEAILASDLSHGTGPALGGILLEAGAVLICFVMLSTSRFGRATPYMGILMHGLDLVHIVCAPFLPGLSAAFMMIAGVFYPFWFGLVGWRLFRLARTGEG